MHMEIPLFWINSQLINKPVAPLVLWGLVWFSFPPSSRVDQEPDQLSYFKNIKKTKLDPIGLVHYSFERSLDQNWLWSWPVIGLVRTSYVLTNTYVTDYLQFITYILNQKETWNEMKIKMKKETRNKSTSWFPPWAVACEAGCGCLGRGWHWPHHHCYISHFERGKGMWVVWCVGSAGIALSSCCYCCCHPHHGVCPCCVSHPASREGHTRGWGCCHHCPLPRGLCSCCPCCVNHPMSREAHGRGWACHCFAVLPLATLRAKEAHSGGTISGWGGSDGGGGREVSCKMCCELWQCGTNRCKHIKKNVNASKMCKQKCMTTQTCTNSPYYLNGLHFRFYSWVCPQRFVVHRYINYTLRCGLPVQLRTSLNWLSMVIVSVDKNENWELDWLKTSLDQDWQFYRTSSQFGSVLSPFLVQRTGPQRAKHHYPTVHQHQSHRCWQSLTLLSILCLGPL